MTGHNLPIKGVQENVEFPMANGTTRQETLLHTTMGRGAERHDIAVILDPHMPNPFKKLAALVGRNVVAQQLHDTNICDHAGRPVYRMAGPRHLKNTQG